METKITRTFKNSNGQEISNIEFTANTGVLTDKSVEQHVHVKTQTEGSGRNKSVSTSTSFSYTTRVSMDDENGESHEVTLPGKNFSCPHNGLVSFIDVRNVNKKNEYYYSVFSPELSPRIVK